MAVREIRDDDLEAVRDLLVEGFPLRSADYWAKGLANLGALPQIEGFPRYGYLVEADGAPQGVLLTINSDRGGHGPRTTHFSSWYVREPYRQFALLLLRSGMDLKDTIFVNPSPSDFILPILKRFGYEPYTAGMVMLDPRTAARRGPRGGTVRRLGSRDLAGLSDAEGLVAEDHLRMGCEVLRLETDARAGLLIHRRKWIRRAVPCSQVILADPGLVLELAGPVMRAVARRGSLVALCDVGGDRREPAIGRVFTHQIRYFKGPQAPAVGDLAYSELAVFGP